MNDPLRVSESLDGKCLLITGVTGFVGKALLEKLVRSCPELKQINLILRASKEHATAEARFWQEIFPSSVFDRLRHERGEEALRRLCEERICCYTGEITASRLGLEAQDYEALSKSTDLVINSAASVNFREPLDQALQINTLSLLHLADFLRAAGDIPLVHVSTCYVHGYHEGELGEEQVQPFDEEAMCVFGGTLDEATLIDRMHDQILTIRHQGLAEAEQEQALIDLGIGLANRFGWNDTYTFTKWLGEQLLHQRIPQDSLTIVRPAIIESAECEPVPGWIEGVKVADALTLAYARQRFTLFPARRKGVVDVIPVDRVVNALLLATAERLEGSAGCRLYQVCSGSQSPITIGEYIDIVTDELRQHWERYPRLTRQRYPRHGLKAVHRRAFLAAMQSQKTLLKAKMRLHSDDSRDAEKLKSVDVSLKLATIYSFYTNPRYVFSNHALQALSARFSDSDRDAYPVGCARLDWQHYLRKVHLPGLERYGMSSAHG